jgi:hypothetical protein
MLHSSGGNRTVYPMHRQASAVSLPMCFLQRFNYSLLPASRFRIGNRTDGHCTEVRANDTGHQRTRRGKVAACSFLICSLTKHEIKQDEMGGTHRMFEGHGKCIQFVGKVPPGSMASLDVPCFTESLPTLQQAYIKANHQCFFPRSS